MPSMAPSRRNGWGIKCYFWIAILGVSSMGAPELDAQCQRYVWAWDANFQDKFGSAVAIGPDLIAIGSPQDDDNGAQSGSVYLFMREDEDWVPSQKLIPLDGQLGDRFGTSLILQDDILVVGAPGRDDVCPSDPNCDSGAVYVFELQQGVWVEVQKLLPVDLAQGDHFGEVVEIEGDVIAAAAPDAEAPVQDCGAVYLFHRDGTSWIERQKVTKLFPDVGQRFGNALSLHGDRLAVGCALDDRGGTDKGSTSVFRWRSNQWNLQSYLLYEGGLNGDQFGTSVALEGDRLVVGVPGGAFGAYRGKVAIYEFDDSTWEEEARIYNETGTPGDRFGQAVALEGATLIVGSPLHNLHGQATGSFSFFEQGDDNDEWTQLATLCSERQEDGEEFGGVMSCDSSRIIMGAPNGNGSGLVYVHRLTAKWLNYGVGWPGTNGIPNLISDADPVPGSLIKISLENRIGSPTTALMLVGNAKSAHGTPLGGAILVLPFIPVLLSVPATGLDLWVPIEPWYAGTSIFLQALLMDPGASFGVSFTRGLDLGICEY